MTWYDSALRFFPFEIAGAFSGKDTESHKRTSQMQEATKRATIQSVGVVGVWEFEHVDIWTCLTWGSCVQMPKCLEYDNMHQYAL